MENFGHEPVGAENFSLKDFEDLIQKLYLLRSVVKDMEAELDQKKTELEGVKEQVMSALEASGKSSYKSERGTVTVTNKFSVQVPQDLDSKKAFFAWLNERGIFEDYATVHSSRLNSLYNEHLEISGDPDFKIPGLGPAKHYKTLSIRSK